MSRSLFRKLLVVMCAIASASVGLVLVIQERTLSADLERAAFDRLDRAAEATRRLLDMHLDTMGERYRAISSTPQFRATLEVDDAPTLQFYAQTLLDRHHAQRVAFVGAGPGAVPVGAGSSDLDARLLQIEESDVVSDGHRLFAVVAVPIGGGGRLVVAESIGTDLLESWSGLCGATVEFDDAGGTTPDIVTRTILGLGARELRVASSFGVERAAVANARKNLVMASLLGIALAFLASVVVSRHLVRPVLGLEVAARAIGSGDLTTRIASTRQDEIGRAAQAFAEMAAGLHDTILSTVEVADRIDETAARISEECAQFRSTTLAQRAESEEAVEALDEIQARLRETADDAVESAARIEETVDGSGDSFRELDQLGRRLEGAASSLREEVGAVSEALGTISARAEEIASKTEAVLPSVDSTSMSLDALVASARSVDEHIEETARLSNLVADQAEEGRRTMNEVVDGMRATRDVIRSSESTIHALGERINEIGLILTVIESVNDETSLLALNGSIVAARSGEQGRAFSVVSGQLKDLARRVEASTSQIQTVVSAVTEERDRAIQAITHGAADVDTGLSAIERAADSLAQIAGSAKESRERMGRSAGLTTDQVSLAGDARGRMEVVREELERMRTATQEQVALTERVDTNGRTLDDVATEIQSAVRSQASGVARIGTNIESVREIVRRVTAGLGAQIGASESVAEQVRKAISQSRRSEDATGQIDESVRLLERQAVSLHQSVERFRIDRGDDRGKGI